MGISMALDRLKESVTQMFMPGPMPPQKEEDLLDPAGDLN